MISDNSDAESGGQMGIEKLISKINGLEEAISGKPSSWASGKNNKVTSGLALVVSIVTSLWMAADKYGSLGDELQSKHYVFLLAVSYTHLTLPTNSSV